MNPGWHFFSPHRFVARSGAGRLILALVVALIGSPVAVAAAAQQDEDYFHANGSKTTVSVARDQIGLLVKEGREREAKRFIATLKLKVVQEYRGGLYILGLAKPMERAALIRYAREVRAKGETLVAQTGLVVTVPGAATPAVLSDEFIVGFSATASRKEIDALNAANKVQVVMPNPFVKNQFLLRVTAESPLDALAMSRRYREQVIANYAYPNFINVFADHETLLNDTLFGNQWHHRNTGQSGGTVDADTDTSWAWDITLGAAGTVIAVIENGGFDMAHPDLTPNFWVNPGEVPGNGIDDDGNGFIDDVNGWDFAGCAAPVATNCGNNNPVPASATEDHGTAVAGVAAARGNNALGVSGACPNCSLMLLRTGYVTSDWAKSLAFGYAQQRARIITNSWGGGGATPNTITAINNATAAGVVVLFAAGNTTANVCTGAGLDSRVSLADVIAVSSASNQDRKVVWAAIGNCIDILAPSHRGYAAADPYTGTLNVTTTDRTGAAGYNNTNLVTNCPSTEAAPPPANARDYTACFGGTSSATPLTAGIVGLALTVNPGLTRPQVQQLLQDTADRVEDSVGVYALANGFSTPATGVATHAYGRVNAFEAVRVVAPTAQGGKNGVDIFLRDNHLDWGNTEQPSNTLFEATRGFIGHWRSVDIKVDAPPYQPAPTAATFDAFVDETPSAAAGVVNRAYVRVRNRGPATAATVSVKLHWTQFGTALPALPGDFWTAFPANSSNTTQWHPLNCAGGSSSVCSLMNLAYSGASTAGTAADAAQVVQFDFPAPPIDPMLANHFCLMAMVDSPQDPISPASKATFVVDTITPTDNNVTHRNYRDLSTDASDDFVERFFVRNPTDKRLRTVLRLKAPERWKVVLDRFPVDQPFELAPKQEILVTARFTLPASGERGEVTLLQENLDDKKMRVMGGVSYRFRPSAAPTTGPGGASAYLVGTYDLRNEARTWLHLVNPTASHLRVLLAFFDDNEKPLKCVRERLSPNDLVEIDVRKLGLKAPLGVVKAVALHEIEDLPQMGIVGNQRIVLKGAGASGTTLHPVQPELLRAELKRILSVCR